MREHDVVIIGTGFSGLGMAIRLKQAGYDDFVMLERGSDVGGTWYYNTYPGCACDVPSHLYSFSFALNPDWSNTYSKQGEIEAYLKGVADDHSLRPSIDFGVEVQSAAWDEEAQRWDLETSAGPYRARVVIAGLGGLSEPRIPEIPGLENFEGEQWHSARWNHDYDLRGKRVAAIGTGASAIQFVPAIQPEVEKLHVVQRTPPWIMLHTGRPTTRLERTLYRRFPALQKLVRGGIYAGREWLVLGFVKEPRIMKAISQLAKRHIHRGLKGRPDLIEKVTPGYTLGCKRILPSNRWYPTLAKDNVELLTGGIASIGRNSIVTGDGEEREVDAIIFGTGFQVTDMPIGNLVRGRGGEALFASWQGSPRAHLGTTFPGFPNLFMMTGPNTGLGHTSMVYMIESQIAHVMGALNAMRSGGFATIEPRREAFDRWNAEIDGRMDRTVWNTGCASWYIDETGRNATLWPDWTWKFRRRLAGFDASEYELQPAATPAPEPVAA